MKQRKERIHQGGHSNIDFRSKNDIENFLSEENGLSIISNLLKNIFSSQKLYTTDLLNSII